MQRAGIRKRIQAVWRLPRTGFRKPVLHQRARRREYCHPSPNANEENAQNQPHSNLAAVRLPPTSRGNRRGPKQSSDTHQQQGSREDADMESGLRLQRKALDAPVCVGVSGQQCRLKEEKTCRPHSSSSAKPRKNVFAQEQLHTEEQKRAKENYNSEEQLATRG